MHVLHNNNNNNDDLLRTASLDTTAGPILSVFPALFVHSELKSVHPGLPVAFIFKHKLINK